MSVKNYGHTHAGPYFRVVTTEDQLSKILFDGGIGVDVIDAKVGERFLLESGSVLIIRDEENGLITCNMYGHSGQTSKVSDGGKQVSIPLDLADDIRFIMEHKLYMTKEFIYE